VETLDPLNLGYLALVFLMAAAFFAGFIDSVAGGGGLISLPVTLLAGLPPHLALGTGKLMSTVGTTAAFLTYARNRAIAWRVAGVGFLFAFAGSAAGSEVALMVDNAALGKVILFLLPFAALMTFVPVRRGAQEKKAGWPALYVATPLFCSAIGFYDGFFGPGAGSFLLLGLHFILGLNLIAATGTAKVFNLASNISSLFVFLFNGKVYFFVAVPMALANMTGSILGSRMALRGGPKIVRRMLLFSLGLLFVSLIWRYYN
jgi:uncharacterized membrane protein YfcA